MHSAENMNKGNAKLNKQKKEDFKMNKLSRDINKLFKKWAVKTAEHHTITFDNELEEIEFCFDIYWLVNHYYTLGIQTERKAKRKTILNKFI